MTIREKALANGSSVRVQVTVNRVAQLSIDDAQIVQAKVGSAVVKVTGTVRANSKWVLVVEPGSGFNGHELNDVSIEVSSAHPYGPFEPLDSQPKVLDGGGATSDRTFVHYYRITGQAASVDTLMRWLASCSYSVVLHGH